MVMDSPDGVGGMAGWFAPPPSHGQPSRPQPAPAPEPVFEVYEEPQPVYEEPVHEVPESDTAETPADTLAEAEAEAAAAELFAAELAGTEIGSLLSTALQVLRAEAIAELTSAGYEQLDPLHEQAFAQLQTKGGCTAAELRTALELTVAETTQLLKDLERHGWLKRVPSARGPRHVRYLLNERAQQLLRATGYVQARLEGRLAQRIGPQALAELRERLILLIRAQHRP